MQQQPAAALRYDGALGQQRHGVPQRVQHGDVRAARACRTAKTAMAIRRAPATPWGSGSTELRAPVPTPSASEAFARLVHPAPALLDYPAPGVQTTTGCGPTTGRHAPTRASTGACVDCAPGATRCTGNTLQTCNANGSWVDQTVCTICAQNECKDCTPPARQCMGNTSQVCDSTGHWMNNVCTLGCTGGDCWACTPGDGPRCNPSAPNTPQTCAMNGQWQDGTACMSPATCIEWRLHRVHERPSALQREPERARSLRCDGPLAAGDGVRCPGSCVDPGMCVAPDAGAGR